MQKQEQSAKKRYEKPEAKRFPLRPEEAVLGFCKSNAAAGPGGPACRANICNTFGS